MGWTAPRTWVTGEVVTAALMNTHVRDDLLDLDRRTTAIGATVATSEGISSTTFVALATAGPVVTAVTGTAALVICTAAIVNSVATSPSFMGYAISGATTLAAADATCLVITNGNTTSKMRASAAQLQTGLTAGSNTFTAQYRTTGGTATYADRHMIVVPLLLAA